MEDLIYKQLATLGLAGLVILVLGWFALKVVTILFNRDREYVDSLKTTVVNNTAAMNGVAQRMASFEERFDTLPCFDMAARPNESNAVSPPRQMNRRSAPSNSSSHILASSGIQ